MVTCSEVLKKAAGVVRMQGTVVLNPGCMRDGKPILCLAAAVAVSAEGLAKGSAHAHKVAQRIVTDPNGRDIIRTIFSEHALGDSSAIMQRNDDFASAIMQRNNENVATFAENHRAGAQVGADYLESLATA